MNWLRRNAKNIAAVSIVVVLFSFVYSSRPVEGNSLVAQRFHFTRFALPEIVGSQRRTVRQTHPALAHISAYMSTVGAAVAMNDLDGDGLSNDVCYVDTRTDQVIIAPAPGTGDRYPPFVLDESRLDFRSTTSVPVGCLPGDMNEDGRMDLLVYYAGRSPVAFLWRGHSGGGPSLGPQDYVAQEIMPSHPIWITGSATFADLDGDGHLDLVLTNYFRDGSEIYNPRAVTPVFMPDSFSRAFNGGGERIFRWTSASSGDHPSVTFAEVADAFPPGTPRGWGLAIGAYDLDGDLLPELYIAHDFGPDRLYWNRSTPGHIKFELLQGERRLGTPSSKVLGRDSFKGMGVDFGDINGDGIPDIYVSNVTDDFSIQESQFLFVSTGELWRMKDGIAPYIDKSEELGLSRSGWAWESRLDDFDNDGTLEAVQATGFIRGTTNRWPEIQELATGNDRLTSLANVSWPRLQPGDDISGHDRNPFFVRVGERYVNIAADIGFGEDYVSRGIATADVSGNGHLDMIVANMWGPSTFYRNDCPQCGSFIGLHLLLPLQARTPSTMTVRPGHPTADFRGRPAVGAAVRLTRSDGRVLVRQVDGGNGYSGKRSPDLLFGLADATGPAECEVKWRDPEGRPHAATLTLNPGWHTVLLGWPKE